MRIEIPFRRIVPLLFCLLLPCLRFLGADIAVYDFTQPSEAALWVGRHDMEMGTPSSDGVPVRITGNDPYFSGPPRDFPTNQPQWVTIRLKSDEGGTGQLFYFEHGPAEESSVHFYTEPGVWSNVRLPLPALGPRTAFRIDPPGTTGVCVIARLSFEPRLGFQMPEWPKPSESSGPSYRVKSGALLLDYYSGKWGDFRVENHSRTVARGRPDPILGYVSGSHVRWLPLTNSAQVRYSGNGLTARTSFNDPDGAHWEFEQSFKPSARPDAIDVESVAFVNRDRATVFLPLWIMLASSKESGTNKTQALFPGLEYLENEPSSSQADLIVPAHHRLVPHGYKLTFPLMAVAQNHTYLGFIWEQQPDLAAIFDSPDRTFNSGSHVMALSFPGAGPETREDGQLLPYEAVTLKKYRKLKLRGTIITGAGETVVPAVQQYVALRGLPPVPKPGVTAQDFYVREASAWLDSKIREGANFRHAVGDNFHVGPALDAAYYMDWLGGRLAGSPISDRLAKASQEARALVSPAQYSFFGIGHIRSPVGALAYGAVAENTDSALEQGHAILAGLGSNATIYYTPPPGRTDLGRTHWSREANGLAAAQVATLLDRAVFSGDAGLLNDALKQVRALSKFDHSVPRGAQTWEVPLHTPDILASAYLVHAYTLAHDVTGESGFLEEARYWAWTGVPFVYLTPPTTNAVGLYSTIAVLGATEYVAPVWMGLPVQWCGLVFADAIRTLSKFDPSGPWKQLANGITASGIQQLHPTSQTSKQGLLPDSYDLIHQTQNPVPINPATLMSQALPYFDADPLYDFHSFRGHGILVHSPGPIGTPRETGNTIEFKARSWAKPPWHVLVNGFQHQPTLKFNGHNVPLDATQVYRPAGGQLILTLDGPTQVEITQ